MPFLNKPDKNQTPSEELANSVSHGIGLAGAIIAAPVLIFYSAVHGDAWAVAGVSIFITTAILLYLSSTLYHSMKQGKLKDIFQIVDHAAIFLLIAGTYTPFTLGVLNGTFGWTLFGIVWAFAAGGIILKIIIGAKYMKLWVALYVLMGLLIIVAIKPLMEVMTIAGLLWIAAGGAAYILGIIFYAMPQRQYTHFVWHLFVLSGTTCHFVAVMFHSF
ncbi:MAG: hemolysin III family protein [Balneolaceae bacterium]|nr:MAG: hemolysin III family protein [Balneolaceae bacterium]